MMTMMTMMARWLHMCWNLPKVFRSKKGVSNFVVKRSKAARKPLESRSKAVRKRKPFESENRSKTKSACKHQRERSPCQLFAIV